MKKISRLIVMSLLLLGCHSTTQNENTLYFGQPRPTNEARLFMPELIPENKYIHQCVFSPNGEEFYYTISDTNYSRFTIMTMKLSDGVWTDPDTASFSGEYSDHAASFSPDGKTLIFSSTRPFPEKRVEGIWHLWKVRKLSDGWSEPEHVEIPQIKTFQQSHASISTQGNLYFHVNPDNQYKEMDIYRSSFGNGEWGDPIKLGPEINSDQIEICPFIDPNEAYIIFTSYNQPDGYGGGDLYISFKTEEGTWSPAKNLGSTVNSEFEESNPVVSSDGKYLFFASRRPTQGVVPTNMAMYWIGIETILKGIDH